MVSEGSDGGEALPRHTTCPECAAPAYFWVPSIAPAGMIQYTGTRFVGWTAIWLLEDGPNGRLRKLVPAP